eukprot:11239095-Karenia_brevis.AAC.1
MLADCVSHQEFVALSVDGTVRCALSLKGQASDRAPAAERNAAAFGDGMAVRKVLSVRGSTGAL